MWNSRDRANHSTKKVWPKKELSEVGPHNIINNRLVDPQKILIPPLHIKPELIKHFVKALNKNDKFYNYIGRIFPAISDEKLNQGVFDRPQIPKFLRTQILYLK